MRLIDGEALSKGLQDVLKERADEKGTVAYQVFELLIEYLEEQPTIDAVPVVRCYECKHQEDCFSQIGFWSRDYILEQNNYEYHKLDFCSYGERKE